MTPDARYDPLHHLSPLTHHSSPRRPESRISRTIRLHRRLVRLGRVLLATGPAFVLVHLSTDVQDGGNSDTWWTHTVASYDVAIITMVIGAALVWRSPPAPAEGVNDRQDSMERRPR